MKVALEQGAYEARGVIANAQSCYNLFPEPNTKDAPFPVTHYPASGLELFADFTGTFSGAVRGLYWASNNAMFAVIGTAVVQLPGPGGGYLHVGDLPTNTGKPVSMSDNTMTLVIVDGSVNPYGSGYDAAGTQGAGPVVGWKVDITTAAFPFSSIIDPAFYGANRVDFIDGFLIFNYPNTPSFYISDSNAVTFTSLYFAEKIGYNDWLVSIAALHDNVWLFGNVTTEVWFNSGATDFPFQRMPNSILQQGCAAPYSVCIADNAVFWLSQDRWGRSMLMRGEGYTAKRVSNFAVEDAWADYPQVNDCIGMIYQQAGHEIVVLQFPAANATWGYDAATGMWHRRTFGGRTNAWLPGCMAFWGAHPPYTEIGLAIAGDRTAPRLMTISRHVHTDLGTPIERVRAWPHVLNEQKRLSHSQFVAALQPGQLAPDQVSLRWSDDGGQTFGAPVVQTVNNATNGQYSWRRLGLVRDRVYELSWTASGETALNGAWIEGVPAET